MGKSPFIDPGIPWFKPRGYKHFDPHITAVFAKTLATNPAAVAKHGFWPFIHYEKVSRKYDPKTNKTEWKKPRHIYHAGHRDSAILCHYNYLLNAPYENALTERGLSDCVIAYRKLGKSNIHFAAEAFNWINQNGNVVALCFDVTSFFDTLDRAFLKQRIAQMLGATALPDDWYNIFWNITRYSFVQRDDLEQIFGLAAIEPGYGSICSELEYKEKVRGAGRIHPSPNDRGIPQGLPISSLLSNLYLLDFDTSLKAAIENLGGLYRRYSDDIIVVVPNGSHGIAEKLVVDGLLKERLKISEKKTERLVFDGNGNCMGVDAETKLNYLGLSFDGKEVRIKDSSVSRFYRRMHLSVKQSKQRHLKKQNWRPKHKFLKRGIYDSFSHLGKSNFIAYANRASEITGSRAAKGQVRKAWPVLQKLLNSSYGLSGEDH